MQKKNAYLYEGGFQSSSSPVAPEEVAFELIPQTLVHPISAFQIAIKRNDLPQWTTQQQVWM